MGTREAVIGRIIFILLLAFEIAVMSGYTTISNDGWTVGGVNIYPVDVILAVVFLVTAVGYTRKGVLGGDPNGPVLLLILVYAVYQIAVVLPLSASATGALSLKNLVRFLAPRMQVLLVPFLYWFVLPSFRDVRSATKIVIICSVVPIGIALYNFSRGISGHTDNGELRLLWGGTAVLYAFVLVTSVEFFSHARTSVFSAVVAALGLAAANHRSAYVVVGIMIILIVLLNAHDRRSRAGIVNLGLVIAAFLVLFLSIPSLGQSLLSRLSSSLDLSDPTAQDRFYRWRQSWDFFMANPINGSMLPERYYRIPLGLEYSPHNFLMERLATEGVVGIVFYLALISYGLLKALRNRADELSWQMLMMLMFYTGFSLFNGNFLDEWDYLFFALPYAMVLYRDTTGDEEEGEAGEGDEELPEDEDEETLQEDFR